MVWACSAGMEAVKDKLKAGGEPASIDKVFMDNTGMAMTSSMGGASGAIFGSTPGAMAARPSRVAKPSDAAALADLIKAGLEGVMALGGAKPGDKTMIDALHPAMLKAQEVAAQPLHEAIVAVAQSAVEGRDASKARTATMGRAKTLGEQIDRLPRCGCTQCRRHFRSDA